MLKWDEYAVDFHCPSLGTLTPLSSDGTNTAIKLKRSILSVNGWWDAMLSTVRFASDMNRSYCASVYPSAHMATSMHSAGVPEYCMYLVRLCLDLPLLLFTWRISISDGMIRWVIDEIISCRWSLSSIVI